MWLLGSLCSSLAFLLRKKVRFPRSRLRLELRQSSMATTLTTENFQVQPTYPAASVRVTNDLQVPLINSNKLQDLRGTVGQIAYDVVTGRMWECVRQGVIQWRPIGGGGGGGGSSLDYSLKKTSSQNVPPLTEVILTTFTSILPYFDNTGPQWNTATGVYTATAAQAFIITAEIAWSANINNQGKRYLRIYYKPSVGPEVLVREVITQANPSQTEPTPQTATVGVALASGDQVYAKVYQDSGVNLSIDSSGAYTGHLTNP